MYLPLYVIVPFEIENLENIFIQEKITLRWSHYVNHLGVTIIQKDGSMLLTIRSFDKNELKRLFEKYGTLWFYYNKEGESGIIMDVAESDVEYGKDLPQLEYTPAEEYLMAFFGYIPKKTKDRLKSTEDFTKIKVAPKKWFVFSTVR